MMVRAVEGMNGMNDNDPVAREVSIMSVPTETDTASVGDEDEAEEGNEDDGFHGNDGLGEFNEFGNSDTTCAVCDCYFACVEVAAQAGTVAV